MYDILENIGYYFFYLLLKCALEFILIKMLNVIQNVINLAYFKQKIAVFKAYLCFELRYNEQFLLKMLQGNLSIACADYFIKS